MGENGDVLRLMFFFFFLVFVVNGSNRGCYLIRGRQSERKNFLFFLLETESNKPERVPSYQTAKKSKTKEEEMEAPSQTLRLVTVISEVYGSVPWTPRWAPENSTSRVSSSPSFG